MSRTSSSNPPVSSDQPPPSGCVIPGDELHIWAVALAGTEPAAFAPVLSSDERERAARFRAEDARRNYVLSRAAFRVLISRYTGSRPETLRFGYGTRGKPRLASPASDLRFNASHSGEMALFAFAAVSEVGVDVERIRRVPEMWAIAERFFAEAEYQRFLGMPEENQESIFFEIWARKEAFAKGLGDGLHLPFGSFSVGETGEPAVIEHPSRGDAPAFWTVQGVSVAPGYAGAVAYAHHPRAVRMAYVSASDLLAADEYHR